MLSDVLPINIPGVSNALNQIDAMRAKFLAIPANTRLALDKLARVRIAMNRTDARGVTVEQNEAAQAIENNLKRVQLEWNTAAERFSQLDYLRREQKALSMDALMIASQLLTSAGYVIKNADKSIAAVDALAQKYLSPEQLAQINVATVGSGGIGMTPLLIAGIIGAALLLRRR